MYKDELVSVVVVTYNSESYIVELLDSVAMQTYKNIELIISDDCSTDKTIEVCENWCKKNNSKFQNIIFVKKEENEGITYNYNSGYSVANGEYIKFIEGDDLLIPDCIEQNVAFLKKSNKRITFSRAILFGDEQRELIIPNISSKKMSNYISSSKKTYKILLKNDIFVNPTIFLEKKLLDENNGFNNEYKMMVDYPFLIKLSEKGEEIGFFDKVTVKYRKHSNNLSLSDLETQRYISELFYSNMKSFYIKELKLKILKQKNIFTILEVNNFFWVQDLIIKNGNTIKVAKKYNVLRMLCFWVYLRRLAERI